MILPESFADFRCDHQFRARAAAAPQGVFARPVAHGAHALSVMSKWPGYVRTPLIRLPALASAACVESIYVKDESCRFGLSSFKPMGAAYALLVEIDRALGLGGPVDFVRTCAAVRERGAPFTVACATDGNHGRALAWAAAQLGLACVVFLHEGVSAARAAAIRSFGAETRRVGRTYDDSVRAADAVARECGWQVISDVAYDGYERIPEQVMCGYMGLSAESARDLEADSFPTHIFVQAGVGGLAASVLWYFDALREQRNIVNVVVEPAEAACLLKSARAGHRERVAGELDTVMAGLACGEPSTTAWRAITRIDSHFIAIPDAAAIRAMRILAKPLAGDERIVAGESGAAGIAGVLCACAQPRLRDVLRLSKTSRILAINTEGDTDPEVYRRIVDEPAMSA